MKNNAVKKILALVLAGLMVVSVAACGDEPATSDSTPTSASTSKVEPTAAPTAEPTPEPTPEPLKITALLGSVNNLHEEDDAMGNYQKTVDAINEYTNMDVTWEWVDYANIGNITNEAIIAGDFRDIMNVGYDATFLEAAQAGYFWDLTDYLDDYDNLATIPAATRANISVNGRIYALPRSRTLARNGFGFRADWCDNLGIKVPDYSNGEYFTLDEFYDMLYKFTYGDPDGNGVDDTYGLGIDSWSGVWQISNLWFGVPNTWGVDKNGDLVYYILTDEWKTAMANYRKWYSEGLFIPGFLDYGAGKARTQILNNSLAGVGLQVLDDQRKVETYFEGADVALADPEEPIYLLGGYVDAGFGPKCLPTTGFNGMLAISKKNIKTEEQLRQVLQFMNDLNDGPMLTLIDYGFEGVSYFINDDGYIELYTAETMPEGVSSTFHNGFNQILGYYTAEENAREQVVAPANTVITLLENQLYEEDIPYCVPNYGSGYTSATYLEKAGDLDAIINQAVNDYIMGVIDDAGLDEVIATWRSAGGDQVVAEMNAAYHAAGN